MAEVDLCAEGSSSFTSRTPGRCERRRARERRRCATRIRGRRRGHRADGRIARSFRRASPPGATLASLLRSHDVAEPDVVDAVGQARPLFDPRKVRSDQPYRVETRPTDRCAASNTRSTAIGSARAARTTTALVAALVPIAKTRRVEVISGHIGRDAPSLFAAMDAAGETIDLSVALADIFSGEIDFNSDCSRAISSQLLVEKQYRDDGDRRSPGYGPILAAEFDNDGRRVAPCASRPPGGAPGTTTSTASRCADSFCDRR